MDLIKKFINEPLLTHPMNWVIVWVIATIWLLAFHVIMKGFTSMQGSALFNNGPLPNGNALPASQTYSNNSAPQSVYQGIPVAY